MHKKLSKHFRNIPSVGIRLVVLMALIALSFNSVLPVAAAPAGAPLAAPRVVSVSVGAQTGVLTAGTAGSVTFLVTVTKANSGTNNTSNTVTANLSVSSGLPANASASFSPSSLTWNGNADTGAKTSTLTIQTTAATPGGAFTFTVRAVRQGTTSDNASGTRTLTINPGTPTITFGSAPTPTYLGGNFTVSATTNSNGALTYSAVSGPCALVSGATFSTSGAGICVVRANTAATSSYTAGSTQQNVTIAPATPTIGFGPDPYPFYPGGDFTVFAATNSDGARTYSKVSGSCNLVDANLGSFTPTGLGACVVQVNTAATTNFVAGSAQQSVTIIPPGATLYAVSGSTTLPSGPVNVWGYNTDGSAATQPGGPTLEVNQGALVAISLHNNLNEPTSLLVQGQTMIPDLVGVPAGGSKNYVFTADHAGTYLYEAGLLDNAQHQVAMGLYGVLIVRPATAGQAYDNASTAYNDEAVVLLSELDPALNNSSNPAAFDLRNYHPKYWLINGKAHPNTDPIPVTAVGDKVLLRYVNAGLQHHSMAVLGLNQTLIAQDGSPLAHAHQVVAETIAPGETTDALTTIPATAAPDSKFALYDANPLAGTGGMVTFLKLGGTATGGDTTGPTTGALTLVNNAGAIDLSALVDDTNSGGSNITAAEYYIDSTANPPVAMSAVNGFDSPTEAVSGNIAAATLGGLSSGSHTIYVRGQDAEGNWGAFALATIAVDHTGPTVSGLVLNPNPSNGTAAVALSATGDDSVNGNNPIAAAEYTIDGGAAQPMAVNNAAPIASLTASIPAATIAALPEGPHTIAVRSQDSLGNWGALASKNLLVDKTAPTTSNVTANPNPTNGSVGFTPELPVIRVAATFNDTPFITAAAQQAAASSHIYLPLINNRAESANSVEAAAVVPDTSYVKMAEGFIGATGANGTGFPFAASDGLFDSASEQGYADIPLTTLAQVCPNTCTSLTVYVHAQDGAGNWETNYSSVVIGIDKVPPAIVSINRVGANPSSATTVQFLVTFSEAVLGVTNSNFALVSGGGLTGATITSVTGSGAAWTVTASTGSGGGTLGLNLTSATNIRDVAGNALPTTGLPFVGQVYTLLTPPLYFSTSGNSNPPGVGGSADDADIYFWNGAAFSRVIDASAAPYSLPSSGTGNANVDGFDRVDATHFYLSFNGQVNVPGIGNVQDEDVVYFNNGTWSLFFDGSNFGLGGTTNSTSFDLDAISIVGNTLYFSTDNNNVPPGAGGTGDDADIYRWNGGSSYTRVVDASTIGIPSTGGGNANVDGLVWVDATHFYLSFTGNTNLAGVGTAQDVDVVYYNSGAWSLYFDGSARGMAANGSLDVDAFDLP